jgi:hypothetical protein
MGKGNAQSLTEDPIHCPLPLVSAFSQDADHPMFFVVSGLKNDRLANDTFLLTKLVEEGQNAARQNYVSHFRKINIECRNNLLAILDFTGSAKELDEMVAKIIAVDDVGLA